MNKEGQHILIVDDEEDLCEILQYNLESNGFKTDIVHSAEEALKKDPGAYDLFLLDVMMGEMSGFRLADKLRKELKINVPVIFLTARDTENDLLTGFSLGADDYISKPFSINELIARIKAVLKRSRQARSHNLEFSVHGDLHLDKERKKLFIDGNQVNLTRKEFEIVSLLIDNEGKFYTREKILELVWPKDVIVSSRIVDVNITRIRAKIGKYASSIRNKTGFGYYFET